ncbi:MAG TPA: ABC transporter substrate-binding protein [Gaiellaceae bacterium]|nr:ABC transporter substrate-binding protein [Gaiellaceae bacterium]
MDYLKKRGKRFWLRAGTSLAVAAAAAGIVATTAVGRSGAATPVRIGILTDCQGAFGAWYERDIEGAQAALAQYIPGMKPKDPNKGSAGMTTGNLDGHPVSVVGYGCGNDRADTAIKETRRLMEQLHANVLIGPLSGDESIAVANYAKAHPQWTFINGTAGAQDTTLKVRAPNFFRFNGDGAQWNAGTADIAYRLEHWRKAAAIMDDYSFAWTSAAGFIAEFCAVGGKITARSFPPLNTTDYSSFVRQLPPPSQVDGYFWAVGGSGLIPSLKAFEQAYGPLDGKQFAGNLFWGVPGSFQALGTRVANALVGGFGTAGDLKTAAAKKYAAIVDRWYKKDPPFPGSTASGAADGFLYNYFNAAWALTIALRQTKGDPSPKPLWKALSKVVLHAGYGTISLDKNRNAIQDQFVQQLYLDNGKLNIRTIAYVPKVDQTFGGTFSSSTPPPGRTFPPCKKRSLPWAGKERAVVNGVITSKVISKLP